MSAKAWALAWDIERVQAGARAAASRGPGRAKRTPESEFDPLAATCLAMLIESRMEGTRNTAQARSPVEAQPPAP